MNSAALARLHLENDLQHALERREFVLHYQPQVRYTNGAILGMEALIRWQRPDGQLVSPLDFIPIAEDNGLIIPIGEWVLREACRSLAQWRKLGHTSLRMAINISARQFRSAGLVEAVRRALADFAVPAHCLELEITESVAMENPQETIRTLRAIKDMGVSLSIDDFGTGYSSLAYLKLFPIDYLKLDRAFVKDIEVDPNDAVICAAAVSLAHSMKLKVVAEGVESAAQAVYLNDQGVDLMQGFLFSRPVQRDNVPALLTARLRETHPVP
jgi:EAL domain-containing protein (putative c-di-GMP-specific phosphodiesterase class I)